MSRESPLTPLLGMWVFLLSETLFFGGLVLAIAVFAYQHAADFAHGTREMKFGLGTLNTAILLTSSWTMALAVEGGERRNTSRVSRCLAATAGLGVLFLAVKGFEYWRHYDEGLFPGLRWRGGETPGLELFFAMYFLVTALHALHLLIGVGLVGFYRRRFHRRGVSGAALENLGLYWHFVDVVWVFLYPALYLCGRNL